MLDPTRILAGLALSALVGGLGHRRGSLTRGGWIGAILIGTATLGLGGWAWGLLVVLFFVLSSALSHFREAEKGVVADEKFSKGNTRDLWQALANGGASALFAVAYAAWPSPQLFAAGLGALATAAADTWATELGVLARRPPRLVTSGRQVEPGTSGAVSALGTGAATAGGLAMGLGALLLTAAGLGNGVEPGAWMVLAGTLGGLAGALFDSLLGATAQGIRRCPRCERETERAIHSCGAATVPLRGLPWLENDMVNFLSTLFGAFVAVLVGLALS